jgi:hypothetical protein
MGAVGASKMGIRRRCRKGEHGFMERTLKMARLAGRTTVMPPRRRRLVAMNHRFTTELDARPARRASPINNF